MSIFGQMLFGYNKQNGQNGNFTTMQVSPYFLVQLNKRFLVEASIDLSNVDGVGIGNAQIDILLNKWMTLNIGRFITPIGQFNLWYNHEWVNRLPDPPLMFNQVSPADLDRWHPAQRGHLPGRLADQVHLSALFWKRVQVAQKPANYSQSVDLGRHYGWTRRGQLAGLRRPTRALDPTAWDQHGRLGLLQRHLQPRRPRPLRPLGIGFHLPSGKLVLPDRIC